MMSRQWVCNVKWVEPESHDFVWFSSSDGLIHWLKSFKIITQNMPAGTSSGLGDTSGERGAASPLSSSYGKSIKSKSPQINWPLPIHPTTMAMTSALLKLFWWAYNTVYKTTSARSILYRKFLWTPSKWAVVWLKIDWRKSYHRKIIVQSKRLKHSQRQHRFIKTKRCTKKNAMRIWNEAKCVCN